MSGIGTLSLEPLWSWNEGTCEVTPNLAYETLIFSSLEKVSN